MTEEMLKAFHVCFKKEFFFHHAGSNDHHRPQNMVVVTFVNKARWYKEYNQKYSLSPCFFPLLFVCGIFKC